MTNRNIELTRRKILASVGAVGAAGAGAGMGTSALFSDEEEFEDNVITAGTLDLLIGYYSYWDQDIAGSGRVQGTQNGGTVSGTLTDVKPGDNGLLTFCPRIETNDAYLWLCGELVADAENSVTEPEASDDPDNDTITDTPQSGQGELAENIDVTVSYCQLDDDVSDGGGFDGNDITNKTEITSDTLAGFLGTIQAGVPLDGAGETPTGSPFDTPGEQKCFSGTDNGGTSQCLCIEWEVPKTVDNRIQSDSIEFDLTFYAQQCRNNDGTNNPCCPCGPDEYAVEAPDGTITCVTEFSGSSVEDIYDYAPGPTFSSENSAIQTDDTANVFVNNNGGDRSLVIVNDGRDGEGGVASFDIDFENSGSYTWKVKDDEGTGTTDGYSTGSSSAEADWTWAGGFTDGGAVGSLDAQFDIDLTARFNGSADIDRGFGGPGDDITTWQVIQPDGSGVETAVTLADGIGETDGEYTARLFRCSD